MFISSQWQMVTMHIRNLNTNQSIISSKGTLTSILLRRRSVFPSKTIAVGQEGLIKYLWKMVARWRWYMVKLRSFGVIISFLATRFGWPKYGYAIELLLKQTLMSIVNIYIKGLTQYSSNTSTYFDVMQNNQRNCAFFRENDASSLRQIQGRYMFNFKPS